VETLGKQRDRGIGRCGLVQGFVSESAKSEKKIRREGGQERADPSFGGRKKSK